MEQDSDLLVDQLRAIDNKRLIEGPLARLGDDLLKRVYQAAGEVLGGE
jgi:mRNA interferase MazF